MCHGRHAHHHRTTTARRPAEDVFAQDPELRASDREREDTVTLLREHGAAGRLDVDELEERIGSAYAARTRGDLATLLRDLPRSLRPRAATTVRHGGRRRHHGLGHSWLAFAQVAAVLIGIWALTGAGYFWPVWVLAWWGFALVMRTAPGLLRTR
ncbi:MAG: DUF1707 domain-containing protein [Solirubrobacteraceae bacterium]